MEKLREYRPALAAFLLMMAMSLTTTALSFFVGPVCNALGFGRGSFTVYYSLMTATGAFSIPILGQIINKRGIRGILAVSAFWVAAGLCAFSLSGALWMFYAAGAGLGLFGTSCVSLCANVIVQQSYSGGRASGLLGLVMSGSGVGGMIVSLLLPGLIEDLGWRMCYRLLALCWLVLGLSVLALLGKADLSGGVGQRRTPVDGMTRAQALRSRKLYLLTLVMFLLTAACGIQQQIPSVLAGFGFATDQVSAMVSFFTAALALGKITQGILYSRLGTQRGGLLIVAVFAGSFLVLGRSGLVYPGLAMLAVGMGSVTTLMPTLTRFTFGALEYAAIWSILSTASSIGALIATPLFGMAYDAFGSYAPAMTASSLGLALCLVLMGICFRK